MTRSAPKLLEMIAALVATPSVSSTQDDLDQGNRAVIDLLANWLDALGFSVQVLPLLGQAGKANLIATLGDGPGGLVLSGHADTVPCNPAQWRSDPFQLTEREGRLHGLGTADMKSFFALAIEAALDFTDRPLSRPLTILATADEECSMAGAKALVEAGRPRGDCAVIGEPTGLKPVRMHKGIMMEAVTVYGRGGHSSDPSLGVNALEVMARIIDRLIAWRHQLQTDHRDGAFAVPVPTMNFGHIHGGDSPNRICPECRMFFDLRTLPGMDQEALRAALRALIDDAVRGTGARAELSTLTPGTPSLCTDAHAAIVTETERLTHATAGAVAFSTEGPYLQQLGMDTVILGPGDIDQAHQADESLPVDRLQPGVELLKKLIARFCIPA